MMQNKQNNLYMYYKYFDHFFSSFKLIQLPLIQPSKNLKSSSFFYARQVLKISSDLIFTLEF